MHHSYLTPTSELMVLRCALIRGKVVEAVLDFTALNLGFLRKKKRSTHKNRRDCGKSKKRSIIFK